MPIVAAVVDVLAGRIAPEHALAQLMRREARAESPIGDA
jgi:glycerol-3-phosphate dehydrogenase